MDSIANEFLTNRMLVRNLDACPLCACPRHPRSFAAKYHAVEASWRVVDLGLDVTGGAGIFRSTGYERLLRDARLGRIHPANAFLTHEVVAKTALGISLDEQPRWG